MRPIDPKLFFSKGDPEDPRLGEMIKANVGPESAIHLFGWADDSGIAANGGRVGAARAPDEIRAYLYKMTPSMNRQTWPRVFDGGNLPPGESLAKNHQSAREIVGQSYDGGAKVITLGGGHDYGFADGAAFLDSFCSRHVRPLIVNFDAHLDVRPSTVSMHSGTAFRRLFEAYAGRFDLLVIGLQPQCNSRAHAAWATAQGAQLWMANECRDPGALSDRIRHFTKSRPTFLSLDIDAITSDSAPGCSAPSPRGLSTEAVFAACRTFHEIGEVQGMGIYEVSPPHDPDGHTSRLAALFVHDFISAGATP